MNEETLSKVVFLDTNAMHFVHLYLMHAREKGLYPFSPGENTIVEAKRHLDTVQDASFKQGLEQGLDIVDSLSKPDVRVEYSPVSVLELIAGRARGRAVERAAREGIPDRMWTRFSEKEVDARLNTADLADIKKSVEGISDSLEEAGIRVTSSDPKRTRDVFDLAKGVSGLVYLGFADSVIYAGALVAGADYIITRDEYFRKTVNHIRNDENIYIEIRQKLQVLVGQISLMDPDNIALPEAKRKL